jgi:hypothetical protein
VGEATVMTKEPGRSGPASPPAGGGGAVYGLGFIGALVWFWQQADGFGEHVVGVLKAIVWPAFLVYEAFQGLAGLGG